MLLENARVFSIRTFVDATRLPNEDDELRDKSESCLFPSESHFESLKKRKERLMPRMSQTPDAPIQSKFVTVFELHSTDHLDAVAPTTQ